MPGASLSLSDVSVLLQGGQPAFWTPLNLGASLVAWWDAQNTANIALSGSNVTSWTDKQSGIVASQGTGASQPTWSATARNGKPGLAFAGAQVLAFNPALLPGGASPRNISVASFFNGAQGGGGGYPFLYGPNSITAGTLLDFAGDNTGIFMFDGATVFRPAESSANLDRFMMIDVSGTTSANWLIDGNAAENFALAVNTGLSVGFVGSYQTGTSGMFTGITQQIVVCNRALTASEVNKMAGWESWYDGKAGANLPGGHPYKSRAPFVTDP